MSPISARESDRPQPAAHYCAITDTATTRPRLCFVALNAYGALSGRSDIEHIGGAEMQQVTVARGLSKWFDVSFIVSDHGQNDVEVHNGIAAFKAFAPQSGLWGLRFFHPRLTGLWRALSRADADVYYQRMAETATGVVAAFCRRRRRRFVFATAAQYDCLKDARPYRTTYEDWLYRYGLRRADCVFVQTVQQQELLRQNFGRESVVVRSCGTLLQDVDGLVSPRDSPQSSPRVLWIGRFDPEKRPFLAIEVAGRCPFLAFDVIGDGDDAAFKVKIQKRAADVPNVRLHGYRPHSAMAAFYRNADLLLCTSEQEGFPNVFLEAFSCGVPVISTVDPDDLVVRHSMGRVGSTPEQLAEAVRSLAQDAAAWRDCSQRARAYYLKNHDRSVVLPAYQRHLTALLKGRALQNA